jgi:hypothetical protein
MLPDPDEDPVVRDSRREAAITLVLFALAVTYTVGYCTLFGYNRSLAGMTFVLGVPDWVFWGIVVPWCACTVAGWVMSIFVISSNPLEEAVSPPEALADDPEGRDA